MITRRRFIAATTAVALLSACSSDDNSTDKSSIKSSKKGTGDSKAPKFPVTLQTTLGTVHIPAAPKRIVSLGTPDAAIVMGTPPIAIPRAADDPSGIHVWLQDTYPQGDVELLDMTRGIPFDKVADLKPDLIIATDILVKPADYARLSQLAPVVTYKSPGPVDDNPWQDQTRLVGAALGLPDEAVALVKKLDDKMTDIQNHHARWNDLSFSLTEFAKGAFDAITDPDDGAYELVELLGFVLVPPMYEVELGPGGRMRPDQLATLDADLVVVLGPADAVDALDAVPQFKAIPAVAKGHDLILGPAAEHAMRNSGAISLPWIRDDLIAKIEKIIPT